MVSTWSVVGGSNVRFTDDSFTMVEPCEYGNRHGIADPFIVRTKVGTLFWMILNPDLAHSPNHQFELPITDVPSAELSGLAQEDDDGEWNCQGCQ